MSAIDKMHTTVHLPRGSGGFRPIVEELIKKRDDDRDQLIQDLRDRNKENREFLAVAKAQIELAQSENKRVNLILEQYATNSKRQDAEIKRLRGAVSPEVVRDNGHAEGDPDGNHE